MPKRCLAFMPAAQGVVKQAHIATDAGGAGWNDWELPLPDAAVDRILLVHAIEVTHDAAALLREAWRVLAPGGRILAVVPNRRGLCRPMDTTPFGHGRPYRALNRLTCMVYGHRLGPKCSVLLPIERRRSACASAYVWERTAAAISAPFAPLHLVGATGSSLSRHSGAPKAPHARSPARAGTGVGADTPVVPHATASASANRRPEGVQSAPGPRRPRLGGGGAGDAGAAGNEPDWLSKMFFLPYPCGRR